MEKAGKSLNPTFYPDLSPLATGVRGSCPRCGRGHLFAGYLTLGERCEVCGLDYDFADAGDGAAWFVMLVAGTLAVAGALFVEMAWQPAYWIHAVVAIPLAVVLPLALLRPVKGVLIAQQYRTRAEEGRTAPRG
jgi:uncharacterized protein (DUF983 family)